ncbi:hypothetical protein ASZ90_010331 [hydrocarbon metagenome]|uniref:Uncharacterized protein n=1 Tax=hydrocarbon metagenome TaxID=938273 RepID=A0A0W8FH16_9ZZZZ
MRSGRTAAQQASRPNPKTCGCCFSRPCIDRKPTESRQIRAQSVTSEMQPQYFRIRFDGHANPHAGERGRRKPKPQDVVHDTTGPVFLDLPL